MDSDLIATTVTYLVSSCIAHLPRLINRRLPLMDVGIGYYMFTNHQLVGRQVQASVPHRAMALRDSAAC